ncbi:MAG: OmpA family protein [Bacteroidota bacterium]
MKKINTLLFILIVVTNNAFAQPGKIKKGDKYFDAFAFRQSIEKYEGITDKTDSIKRNLALGYYNIGEYEKSEKYYAELAKSEKKIAEDVYNYAAVLSVNGKYEESSQWMKTFHELNQDDSRAKRYNQNPLFYDELLKNKEQFAIKNLDINSEQEDFGTCFFKGKIMFASSREKFRITRRRWNWNDLPFLDLYVADKDSLNELKNPMNFRASINKKYHEGPASFNKAGNFMAFTRNNYNAKSKDGAIKLEIYTSEFKEGEWQEAKPLPFNNKDYSVGHAALSKNGRTMYFASDMPGGIGGVDLYVVQKDSNNNWTRPKNLGKDINTEGNEMFPFYHADGFLFFASNGLPGLGGLDIFMVSIIDSNDISVPVNLGVPINSSYDDFALVMDSLQTSGYFSSNRPGGKGDDDIYRFDLLKPFERNLIVNVFDTKGNSLSDTEVNLYDNKGNVLETIKTDSSGTHTFTINENIVYLLKGNKEKYQPDQKEADATTNARSYVVDLILKKMNFSLVCVATDAETKKNIPEVSVTLLDKTIDKKENLITDSAGYYKRALEEIKIGDTIHYNAVFEKEGYLTNVAVYNRIVKKEGEIRIEVELNKIEVGTDLGKIIDINPIYFDLSKWNIRPDAAIELDKIVKVMIENPEMIIELGSHTDSRGSTSSNLRLSDRRAKSSAKYIKERIPNPERIKGKGYGESQIINKCKNGVRCSEDEHQLNRRTEFKIIKIK